MVDRTERSDAGDAGRSKTCRTMSVTQVARVLGISRTSAYECVRTGELPALKLGGRIVIPTQVVEELLEQSAVRVGP